MTVLEAAQRLINLLPDVPDSSRIYQLCPWWCILHYLMQATTVLLLELSFGCFHMPEAEKVVLATAKKGIRWIFAMSESSLASRRAWELCDRNLRRLAEGSGFDLSDLPAAVYQFDNVASFQQPLKRPPPNFNPRPPVSSTVTQFPALASSAPMFNVSPAEGSSQEHTPLSQEYITNSSLQQHLTNPPRTEDSLFFPPDLGLTTGASNDIYFPNDPITGEFISSFFPNYHDEGWGG